MNLNRMIVSTLQLLPKGLVKPFAMRYIAGETIDDAIRVVRNLNSDHMMATVDILGENVTTKEESLAAVREEEEVLHAINRERLDANLSIKLTQFGLKIDESFCYSNVKRLLEIARKYDSFVRIDMEDSSTTTATLQLYERLRADGFENVGVVVQAYLKRSQKDIEKLAKMKGNVRLCKGAYVESEKIAFTGREEIRQNFMNLLKALLSVRCYVAIATHDDLLVNGAYRYIQELNSQKSDYEFQMLHGVKTKLRNRIVSDGHGLRVYVPFGPQWYTYSMRRFKENPQIVRHVLRALFYRR